MTTIYDVSCCTTETSEYELNAETLDQLYKDQLHTLRELIIKQNQSNDIELCRKWLQIFAKTSKAEKMARNCLCALMQQQLQNFGYLGEPFTNAQNCNRDLEQVLRELDDQSFASGDNFTQRSETVATTFMSHRGQRTQAEGSDVLSECLENETQMECVRLRHELDTLRLQLTEKNIENVKLKEIAEKYKLVNAEPFENIKKMLLDGIKLCLDELANDEHRLPFKLFETIFGDFATDSEFSHNIRQLDDQLQKLLNQLFQRELNKRKALIARHVSRKLAKAKTKLRQKYERRLDVQNWVQRLQLKLVKLKCFSVLRQTFINAQKGEGNDDNMWNILMMLEEKYQSVVNELS